MVKCEQCGMKTDNKKLCESCYDLRSALNRGKLDKRELENLMVEQ